MQNELNQKKGLVIVYTGDGKGKTTAALGILLRAWGRGMRVSVLQFIKSTASNCGEHQAARKIGVEMKPLGDGFTWRSKNVAVTRGLALELWELCKVKMQTEDNDILILDEFTYPLQYDWIPVAEVIETLRRRPKKLHVIITGRAAPAELIEFADLVTEMHEIKHPYKKGIKARPGIDF